MPSGCGCILDLGFYFFNGDYLIFNRRRMFGWDLEFWGFGVFYNIY